MPTENLITFVMTVLLCTTVSRTNAQAGTLGFFLDGIAYPNGSTVLRTDIGEGENALQCTTDSITCCRNVDGEERAGDFHFPVSDAYVPHMGGIINGYFRDRQSRHIRLHRQSTGTITGRFRCNIPQASGLPDANLYINIVDILVSISPFGSNIAGDGYRLVCTVTVTGSTDQPTITWLDPMNNMITSGVETTGSMSTLTFNPLAASHAGTYTCRAMLGGAVQIERMTVTVQIPAPTSVMVTPPVVPIIESSITLTCTVELSSLVDVPVTVTTEWSGPDGFMTTNTAQPVVRSPTATYTSTAIVSSSGIEQSGNYTCKATIRATMSSTLIDSVGYSSSIDIVIVVPEPTVSAHSDSFNHLFYDHYPTLICTVEMSSVVTVPLSMTLVWRGPDGTIVTSPIRPEMKSFTLYTSSSILTSVDSADSGEYTCTVRFENGVEISASTNVTIVDGVFQLRLKSVGICQQYYSESSDERKQYSNFIKGALIIAIKHHCKCHFSSISFNKFKDVFICEDSPNVMIYRNTLIGTLNFNGTQIVDFIQDWVNTGPLIEIDGRSVRVDSSCPTAISSLDEPVCGEKEEKCLYDNDPKYAMCAQHLANNNIATCFEGCVVRNG